MALDFNKWKKLNEEASLRNNPGIPGQGQDKSFDYLSDVERRAIADADRKGINRRTQMSKTGELMQSVDQSGRMQRGKETDLEKLAEEVIRENYGAILDNVELNLKIVRPGSVKFPEQEEAEEEEQPTFKELNDPEIKKEIDKRKITNNIIQGEGKNTKHILHSETAKNGLIKIFGRANGVEIHRLYNTITTIMESLDWLIPMEVQERMWKENPSGFAGKCKVEWKEDKPEEDLAKKVLDQIEEDGDLSVNDDSEDLFSTGKPVINATGVDFPMLLHEAVKGIYELIASVGTPKDEEVAKIVSLNADVLSNELEDLRYGPYIAADIRDFILVNTNVDKHENVRQSVFGKMMLIPADEFLKLIFGILKKTTEARVIVDKLIDDCIKELDEYELSNHLDIDNSGDNDFDPISKDSIGVKSDDDLGYEDMGKSDLEKLIDKYLDEGNFEEVKKIDLVLKSKFK